jgi:FkbM family methyltransferase
MTHEEHLSELDRALQPYLRPDFFFVNVGASDGVTNDPIYPFIERYGWHGLAIEPVPHVFERPEQNYAHLTDSVDLVQAAVSEAELPIWYVADGTGLEDRFVTQISSLDRSRLEQTLRELKQFTPPEHVADPDELPFDHPSRIRSFRPRCVAFNDLMAAHGVERIDFLNIDAEGLDYQILASIDVGRYLPTVLCIEIQSLDSDERARLRQYLRDLGYRASQMLGTFSYGLHPPGPPKAVGRYAEWSVLAAVATNGRRPEGVA